MSRYVARTRETRAWDEMWVDDGRTEPLGQPRIHERGPVWTGLLDQHGNDICRMPDEMGFVRRRDA